MDGTHDISQNDKFNFYIGKQHFMWLTIFFNYMHPPFLNKVIKG